MVAVATCETCRSSGNRCKVDWMVTAMNAEDSMTRLTAGGSRSCRSELERPRAGRVGLRFVTHDNNPNS